MKVKFSNYLLEAVLQAMLAVCWEIKFERKTFKLLIGGSTASNACSMQGYKSEKMQINTAFFKKTIDERHVL